MGFGRGFAGGSPDKTDGGLKRIRNIERNSDIGDATFTTRDISKGAINRIVSGQRRDIISFNDVDKFAEELGISIGDDFDFRLYVDNPNRGEYSLVIPDSRTVSGVEIFGDIRGLSAFAGEKCIHEINFFYVTRGKLAITVRTDQPSR